MKVANRSQTFGESGTSLACKDRLGQIEWMRPIVSPMVKNAVTACDVEGSEGQVGLVNLRG